MTALIALFGAKVVGWLLLAVAGAVGWATSMLFARRSGAAQQRGADAAKREGDLVQANRAAGDVGAMDDGAVLAELHARYDRK